MLIFILAMLFPIQFPLYVFATYAFNTAGEHHMPPATGINLGRTGPHDDQKKGAFGVLGGSSHLVSGL